MNRSGRLFGSLMWLLLAPQIHAQNWCSLGVAHPQAPAETAQFAFLLGDHDVTLHGWTAAGWSPPRPINAQWRGRYALDGHAITDEWIDPNAESENIGVNVRMFDSAAQLWKMMWISTSGKTVQDLRAQLRDGVLTMWQVHPPRPGWKAEFESISESSWARVGYQQDAAGEWQPQFRLVAIRKPC